jgi:hypothetical protein
MKSLYESILSSTKSGGASKICEWWDSNPDNKGKGKYTVENINGKLFIVMDDFENQPRQTIVNINKEELETMPKQLSGIYYMYYKQKGAKGIMVPVTLHFTYCPGCKIDLSNWDMSLGPIARLTIHILIMFSSPGVELVGLPKYSSEFNVKFYNCTNIKGIRDLNAPNGEIEFGDNIGYTSVNYANIKNCTLREFFVNKADIMRSSKIYDANIEFYKTVGKKRIIDPQYADCIHKLLKNNKIEKLRYQSFKSIDSKSLYGHDSKLVPYKTADGIETFAIIPLN